MTFSVVVPVYNAEKYLASCLESIRSQSFTDWECILVDDGSTDGSGAIIDSYAAADCRFRAEHRRNEGEGGARNAGVSLCSGDIVGWVDSDDLLLPGVLEEVARLFAAESPDMVRIRHLPFEGTPPQVDCANRNYTLIEGKSNITEWAVSTLACAGYCWLTFTRRSLLTAPFPVGVQYAGDALYTLANVVGMNRILQSEFCGYLYRDTPGSIMKKPFPSQERVRFLKAYRALLDKFGEDSVRLSWMGWFNLVNWALRPKDRNCRNEIHSIFCGMLASGKIKISQLPSFARIPAGIYAKTGWLWPVRLTYSFIKCAIAFRDSLRAIIHAK